MAVNNDNIKIFSEKNWLLLCKRPYDFVYMNTLDNQYYSIKETKTLKNIAPLLYSFSISTGMIFKYLLPFFDWNVSINFRFISLFLILLLVVILTKIQLKKAEQWAVGNPITLSSEEEKEIIAEAKQTYKTNITFFSNTSNSIYNICNTIYFNFPYFDNYYDSSFSILYCYINTRVKVFF